MLIDSLLGRDCGDSEKQLNYSLIIQDSWKIMLNEWYIVHYEKADSLLKDQGKEGLMEVLGYLLKCRTELVTLKSKDEHAAVILKMIKSAAQNSASPKIVDSLFVQSPSTAKRDSGFSIQHYLSALRSSPYWIFHWLWYNYQWLVIDPVPVASLPDLETRREPLNSLQDSLQQFLQQKRFLDSVKAHVPPDLSRLREFKSVLDSANVVAL
jgi:hypothetical protein